ncbi:hypothetical protein RF11_04266 [Thelohanellus kitauei]|uniref:Uncharacterized protein n=1 Tax=Thelohanellus kitauei TaxID=669202 RepID=A0A0C2N5T7_THEKT|nr:hypothetical protein RF11_04266 [Thelohanellus kitauei]
MPLLVAKPGRKKLSFCPNSISFARSPLRRNQLQGTEKFVNRLAIFGRNIDESHNQTVKLRLRGNRSMFESSVIKLISDKRQKNGFDYTITLKRKKIIVEILGGYIGATNILSFQLAEEVQCRIKGLERLIGNTVRLAAKAIAKFMKQPAIL